MRYSREESCSIVRNRVDAICADQRAYIYVRKMHKQHDKDGIGGGNLSMALTLFAVLDFLGKIQFFMDKKGQVAFDKNGKPKIESDRAFTHLVAKTRERKGFNLGLDDIDNGELCKIWDNIRNKLTHVCTTTQQMETFLISDPNDKLSVSQILAEVYKLDTFVYENDIKTWRVNVDVLLARTPSIAQLVSNNIMKYVESSWLEDLKKLIG